MKTNTRIADERLLLLLPWAILFTSAEVFKFSRRAISCNPSQNSFSRDTLVLCPSSTTERLMMSVFTMFPRAAYLSSQDARVKTARENVLPVTKVQST